jgi:hypothetical protein
MRLYSRRGVSTLLNFPEASDVREMFKNRGYVIKFAFEKVGIWLDMTDHYPEKWIFANILKYNSFAPEYLDDRRRIEVGVDIWRILSEEQLKGNNQNES